MDPANLRFKNFIPAAKFPYKSVLGWEYDSGNYPAALEKAKDKIGSADLRKEQSEKRQRGEPLRPFVLKTPSHLGYLETLLDEFPDAHIVHAHRDPVDVIPSGASLNTTLWRTHCDDVDPHEVGRQWIERMGWACDRAMASRAGIPAGQVTDVRFTEALVDPIGTAGTVLDAVGLGLTDETIIAMEAWIAQDRKREKLPVHRYTSADFGLSDDQIRERFASYTHAFL